MELDYVKLKEIKPLLSGYLRESQILLKESPVPDEDMVHDIRVLMKKSRAVLKLTAPQLDNGYNDRDLESMKETGKLLCNWRDTSVQRKILKSLKKDYPSIFSELSGDPTINSLLEKKEEVSDVSPGVKSAFEQIESNLRKTSFRIRFQTMTMVDPQLLIKELDLTYKKVGEIYLLCRNNTKPESLHKFRKRAKDFLYQLYIFRPLNPSIIKSLEKKLDGLTSNLGKYHDLALIIDTLGYKYEKNGHQPAMDELIIKIREAQDGYLRKVWPAAYQVFCPGQSLVNILGFKLLVI